MEQQNFENHARFVKGYHYVLSAILFLGLIASGINVYLHLYFIDLFSCILIFTLFVCSFLIAYFLRTFPMKAQDRAIRAEESLRHFILSGKAIDKRLTLSQIIALRFASDEEFLELAEKAAAGNLSNKDIKKAIQTWRADHHRV